VAGSVAGGFFQEMGSDLYRAAKEKVDGIIKHKKNPIIKFEMPYKKTDISIESYAEDEKEIDKVFDTMDKARDLAISELDKKTTPDLTKLTIRNEGEWAPVSGQDFKPKEEDFPRFFKYNKKTGKWEIEQEFADEIKKLLQSY
jgi:hypothetical protein